ncbi:hypothetical protein MBAV_003569 [Candidatus Magnetobacterium bavaricum]|uniref:Uncharacterized protein n=1 Tax=Candidatus Magnetobacterium bavaricum TaxID=29290 RepID=A0A0F3GU45_9BACT|nr:hypothetical protein MBAV_003569 [Candidatus Magnetobacterium bavaricum]
MTTWLKIGEVVSVAYAVIADLRPLGVTNTSPSVVCVVTNNAPPVNGLLSPL